MLQAVPLNIHFEALTSGLVTTGTWIRCEPEPGLFFTAQVSRISRQPQGPVYGNPAAQTPTVNTGAGGWSQQPAQSTQPAAPADDPWGAPSDDQSSFGGFGKHDPEPEF